MYTFIPVDPLGTLILSAYMYFVEPLCFFSDSSGWSAWVLWLTRSKCSKQLLSKLCRTYSYAGHEKTYLDDQTKEKIASQNILGLSKQIPMALQSFSNFMPCYIHVYLKTLQSSDVYLPDTVYAVHVYIVIWPLIVPYILVYKSNACISRTLFLKPKIQLF